MQPTLTSHVRDTTHATRTRKAILWILIVAAAAEFVVRGPVRFLQPVDWNDLAQNYAASRLWLRGQNPSSADAFADLWLREVHSVISANTARTHLAPPLGGLVLLAPIAALPWRTAKIAWTGVLLVAFGLTLVALASVAGLRLSEPRTLAFIAGALALAPFHTGFGTGNVTIVVIGACAAGIWAAGIERDVAAGVFFAIACSFKPHIGAFIVLYYLVRRRWRLFGSAVAFTAGLAFVAALWMQLRGVVWFSDYLHNARGFVTANRIDDFSSANPIRFMLINLQVPLYSFSGSPSLSNKLALLIGALLVCNWIYLVARRRKEQPELLPLAAIAVICLLPVYHRLYDAALLVILVCWCMQELSGKLKSPARIALVLTAPFLVPGAALLQQMVAQGRIPAAWTHSWYWDRVVMPHQTWLLLLLSLILLYAMAKDTVSADA